MVRCGACRSQFDVTGEGRFPCPHCGAVNQVGADQAPEGAPSPPGAPPLVPPGPPPAPVSKISCGECSFEFVVGDIAVATCPNCNATVEVGEP